MPQKGKKLVLVTTTFLLMIVTSKKIISKLQDFQDSIELITEPSKL